MVRFSDPREFLEELAKDREHIERRIVRLTNFYRPSQRVPSIQHLSVVATARVGRDIIRLEVYCGDLWHLDLSACTAQAGRDQPVLDRAKAIHTTIEEGCARLGLEVRAGMIAESREPSA
jgi:hypothetical protein